MLTYLTEKEFLIHYSLNQNHFMWFLGAGTSRTAGMPTATDLIWDLKIKYYCREENQNIDSHDANNDIIKATVQRYMDSRGFPPLWSAEEYSFYFELAFGRDYSLQQKYIADKLSDNNISLSIGHRALAGLIALKHARLLFTTNFDGVIEKAYAEVANSSISAFHLEGSYAALDALNNEQYPIYAKVHGDFRYQSIKNLPSDLLSNDQEIHKCFVAAASRFGIIVSGYSGRDANVMQMFYSAIDQNNAFPFGLFWTVTSKNDVLESVKAFILTAQQKGIKAYIVETGTFDSLLSKIWNQTSNKPDSIEIKVRTALRSKVNIGLPPKGRSYPVIRTNALKITSLPQQCAQVETTIPKSHTEIKECLLNNRPDAVITKTDRVIAWGNQIEIIKGIGKEFVSNVSAFQIDNPIELISNQRGYQAFYERALATGICNNKPLTLHRDKGFVLSINPEQKNDPLFIPLLDSLKDRNGNFSPLTGVVPNSNGIIWSEALDMKLEIRNNEMYVMIRPVIWISPSSERHKCKDFLRNKVLRRYNSSTHNILNAWITIILGGLKDEAEIVCYKDSDFPATFRINPRTAYSQN